MIATDLYPGDFASKVDVDGLRSMCVSRLRVAVGAGIWRANHKTLAGPGRSAPTPSALGTKAALA